MWYYTSTATVILYIYCYFYFYCFVMILKGVCHNTYHSKLGPCSLCTDTAFFQTIHLENSFRFSRLNLSNQNLYTHTQSLLHCLSWCKMMTPRVDYVEACLDVQQNPISRKSSCHSQMLPVVVTGQVGGNWNLCRSQGISAIQHNQWIITKISQI